MSLPFKKILIYGVGMMGASLAHALKRVSPGICIDGVVRSEASAAFLRQHHVTNNIFIHTNADAIQEIKLSDYELLVLGVPPSRIIEMVPYIPEGPTLITDMSSTRREVHNAMAQKPALRFVGSHPMCGSENRGPQAAIPDLYHGNLCLIIKDQRFKIGQPDLGLIEQMWHSIGMQSYQIDQADHDEILAYLSHTPHLISSALTRWARSSSLVSQATSESPLTITGGGFKGMTRIAGSNPEMWSDIIATNKDNILTSLRLFQQDLAELLSELEKQEGVDWMEWFAKSRSDRNYLCHLEVD